MTSWTAAGARAQWSVEECAEFAARRKYKYVSMLSTADESVVAMALRTCRACALLTAMSLMLLARHDASAARGRDLREDGAAATAAHEGGFAGPSRAARGGGGGRGSFVGWVATHGSPVGQSSLGIETLLYKSDMLHILY